MCGSFSSSSSATGICICVMLGTMQVMNNEYVAVSWHEVQGADETDFAFSGDRLELTARLARTTDEDTTDLTKQETRYCCSCRR